MLVNQMSEKMLRKIELGPRSAFPVRNSPEFPPKGLGIDDLGNLRNKRRLRRTLHPARSAAVEKKSFFFVEKHWQAKQLTAILPFPFHRVPPPKESMKKLLENRRLNISILEL
jgi:hypothetical protein